MSTSQSRSADSTPAEGGLSVRPVKRDPRSLKRLPVNARFMTKEQFDRLTENIRRDGVLTSWPLIWREPGADEGRELIISGNHRVDASEAAGLTSIDAIELIAPDLPKARRLALQISHNAINGQDDLATLAQLYGEIDDIEWRSYSGLDDKTLNELEAVDLEGIAEANLDFATVNVVFLPPELDRAKTALDEAKVSATETWLTARADYEPTLDALTSAQNAHNVGNVATAFGVILDVFERHLDDLRAGYDAGGESAEPRHKNRVGLETVFGTRTIPADLAVRLNRAVDAAVKTGDIEERWEMLDRMLDERQD